MKAREQFETAESAAKLREKNMLLTLSRASSFFMYVLCGKVHVLTRFSSPVSTLINKPPD